MLPCNCSKLHSNFTMKFLFFLLSMLSISQGNQWLTDFEIAKKIATEKKENILLNFSGSDWCGPCMRMKKEIFETASFTSYATDHLVLLNADFPRNKKNKLSKEQESMNDKLAEKYNPDGKFPYTVLLNAQGVIIKKWEGLPDGKAADFITQIKSLNESGK